MSGTNVDQGRVRSAASAAAPLRVVAPPARPPLEELHARIAERTAVVAVVGLGHVGLPLLVAAAAEGFHVMGVDADEAKVASLRSGRSYVVDVGDRLVGLLAGAHLDTSPRALIAADVIIVAVPTPLCNGSPDLSLVRRAMEDVGASLRPGQLVVLESTTYPGTTEEMVLPLLERGGLEAGRHFALACSPGRVDPGSGHALREVPKVVAGPTPVQTELAARFYATLVDRVVTVRSPREAEMAKLVENTFRQVNIALVNELAAIAPALGVDIWEALDAAATKPFGYLPFRPGPGWGGRCIAVDPSYLSWKVEEARGFGIGFIEHARWVNNRMPAHLAHRIAQALNASGRPLRGARVLVLGLTYKAGVDDVEESPAVAVLQHLLAAGADCAYHDPFVPSVVVGGRRRTDGVPVPAATPTDELPRLRSVPLDRCLLPEMDCVVILTAHPGIDYADVAERAPLVFDAVGITRGHRSGNVVLL